MTGIIASGLRGAYDPWTREPREPFDQEFSMFRLLAATWLTRRLAGPIGRAIPNPFLRAAAIAGAGVLATRVLQRGSDKGERNR